MTKLTQKFEKDAFNSYQNFLYKRAMFGLSVYSPEELSTMNADKKQRVAKVHQRCQLVLNLWKQQITNHLTNKIFERIFPKSEFSKLFYVKYKDATDPDFVNVLSFKDLGITKEIIVDKLIREGILPKNFYSLDSKEKEV